MADRRKDSPTNTYNKNKSKRWKRFFLSLSETCMLNGYFCINWQPQINNFRKGRMIRRYLINSQDGALNASTWRSLCLHKLLIPVRTLQELKATGGGGGKEGWQRGFSYTPTMHVFSDTISKLYFKNWTIVAFTFIGINLMPPLSWPIEREPCRVLYFNLTLVTRR
jgi:hypothetical protein